jgi:hypothetical protein
MRFARTYIRTALRGLMWGALAGLTAIPTAAEAVVHHLH